MASRKIVHTADWHFSTKNPVSRTDDYHAALFQKLDQLFKVARHVDACAVAVAGDLFHQRNRARWMDVIRLLEWGQQVRQRQRLVLIPGNHDQVADRYDSRAETPIGVLIGSGIFEDISRQVVRLNGTYGPVIYGVPWPDACDPAAFTRIPPEVDVVLAHAFCTAEGGDQYGVYCHKHDELAIAAPHVRVWHFGHDHADHGVFTLKNGAKVITIGALSRGALDYEAITRTVKVAISDIPEHGPATVQQVALKVAPAAEVFDLALRAKKHAEAQQVAAFVAQLKVELQGAAVDYHPALARLSLPQAVRDRVEAYITQAESTV